MHKISFLAIALVVLSLGCATDPNRQVVAADVAHEKDLRDNAAAKDALQADQAKDHAALDSDHVKERGVANKDAADDASAFAEAHRAAEANVEQARRAFRADVGARLDQIVTKTAAIEKKARKATQPTLPSLKTHTAAVQQSVIDLDAVSDAAWFDQKTRIESSVVALEQDVSAIESRL